MKIRSLKIISFNDCSNTAQYFISTVFYYIRISRMQSRNLIQIKECVFIWNDRASPYVRTNVYQLTLFCEFARF